MIKIISKYLNNLLRALGSPQIKMLQGETAISDEKERDVRYSKPYKCKLCEKSFSTPGYLDTHMRLHTGVKPYTCRICHRGFAQRPGYTYHMRTHSGIIMSRNKFFKLFKGEMRYQCKICLKKFIQIGTLKRHCDTHGIPAKNVDDIIVRLSPTNFMVKIASYST